MRGLAAVAAVICLLVCITYAPTLGCGFIWDDDDYVVDNTALRSVHGLWRIWFVPAATPQYYPATFSTFWLERRLFGDGAAGYHATNVALHAASSVLLWRLLVRLGMPAAALGAAVFAVHPVGVESVAWISERKNTLSCLLGLCFLHLWLHDRFPEGTRRPWLPAAAAACFALAMLAKTVSITLLGVALVISWWRRGRLERADAAILPLAALALPLAAVTVWLEKTTVGAAGAEWSLSMAERLVLAGRIICFYVGKLVWPNPIIFFYPRWTIDATDGVQWLPVGAVGATLLALFAARRRIGRGPLAVAIAYLGLLAPALGFFDVYPFQFSFVADHFQYHAAACGLAGLAAGVWLAITAVVPKGHGLRFATIAVWAWPLVLAVVSVGEIGKYAGLESLYTDTIRKNPDATIAWSNLGMLRLDQHRYREAGSCFERAAATSPFPRERIRVTIRRLMSLHGEGRHEEVRLGTEEVRPLVSGDSELQVMLATALAECGQPTAALAELDDLIARKPRDVLALAFRSALHGQMGKVEASLADAQLALEIEPGNLRALTNLAAAHFARGDFEAAVAAGKRGLAAAPDAVPAPLVRTMVRALVQLGRPDEANAVIEAVAAGGPE
jgi:tetratricopeptide (TPR) repeat protein